MLSYLPVDPGKDLYNVLKRYSVKVKNALAIVSSKKWHSIK